jgi:hypothetical protein
MAINNSLLLFPLLAAVVGLLHIVPPAVDAIDTHQAKKLGLIPLKNNNNNT